MPILNSKALKEWKEVATILVIAVGAIWKLSDMHNEAVRAIDGNTEAIARLRDDVDELKTGRAAIETNVAWIRERLREKLQ